MSERNNIYHLYISYLYLQLLYICKSCRLFNLKVNNLYLDSRFLNLQITYKIARHYTWRYRQNCHIFCQKVGTEYSLPEPYLLLFTPIFNKHQLRSVISNLVIIDMFHKHDKVWYKQNSDKKQKTQRIKRGALRNYNPTHIALIPRGVERFMLHIARFTL